MDFLNKINAKKLTLITWAVMCIIMLWVSKDFGISGDEYTQNTYGEHVYNYFATGGADKGALTFKNVYYYGGLFDLLCVTVNKILPTDEYNTRHFITAIFGFLTIMYASLLAKRYKGWGAAFLTSVLLFLSPRFFGESMYNPKDIPFALGMTMGVYYICRFVAAFPKPSWKDALWLALSIGLAIGVRVGGLLLIPFLFVAIGIEYFFTWRKNYAMFGTEMKRTIVYAVATGVVGYFAGLIFWPYALEAPLSNPFSALSEMSNFSMGIRMLFDDRHIMSQGVPANYIPLWIFITTPIIILVGIVLSPLLFYFKQQKMPALLFLFFVTLFPWVYIVYKHSPLYDGWRHLLFIYPLLIVLAALTFSGIYDHFKDVKVKYAVIAVLVIGLFLPVKWVAANHPNQIVYFNEFTGGIDGAYGHYETDYYMNSIKQAFFKLAKEKDLYNTKDSVLILTNCIEPMWHYQKALNNPRVAVDYVRYRERSSRKYTYGIFFSRFIDKELLQGGYFPPSNTIMVVKADNTPLVAITKPDTSYYGFKATQFMNAKDYANAAYYYQLAVQKEPKDETLYQNFAIALASIGKMDNAIAVMNEYLKMASRDANGYQLLAQLYQAKGDMQGAQNAMSTAQSISMEDQEGIEETAE